MILFLFGPDTYRSRQKLNEIVKGYKEVHKSGLSFHVFNLEENNTDDFLNAAETISMFEKKRLVVAKHAMSDKEFSEKFMEWRGLKDLADNNDTICVFYEHEVDRNNPVFIWLIKNAESQEFITLSGARLHKWARQFVVSKGAKISQGALFTLIAVTGGDLWALTNEIQKLSSYKMGEEITAGDIDMFLRPKDKAHIFSFVDAFFENNKSKAFRLLRAHIEAGDSENYLLAMIHSQLRNVAQAQDFTEKGERDASYIAQQCSMHPYVAKKSIGQARQFSREKIKKTYSKLVDLDISVKTGRKEPKAALEELILVSLL